MKYENEIFKVLCAISLMILLSIFFINKANAQSFVDTTQQNKNIILEEFTGIGVCMVSCRSFNWTTIT